jgi:hypothetical protein
MEAFPPIPDLATDRSVMDGGHLWLLEAVDGGPLRFRLRDDGRIEFADADATLGDPVPPAYAATVRFVRERLDRATLHDAVDDAPAVTFLGVATYRRRVAYDWDRIPPFLGTEIHDGDGFLPPDAVEGAYERLGLDAVTAVRKEVRAVDFDPERFETPASAYRDGPAFGTTVRTKTGERARIPGPRADRKTEADPLTDDPGSVAAELVTDARVDAVVREVGGGDFDAVFERVLERIYRAEAHRMAAHGTDLDRRALRSAVAPLVRERLDGR